MKTIILLFVVSAALSCGRSQGIEPLTHQASIASPQQTTADPADNKQIALGSVELFGTWRDTYVKLDRWKQTTDPNVPHPELFDVVCTIKNKSNSTVQKGDFVVLTTVDFIVAPTYVYSGDITKVIANHSWARVASMDDVRLEQVPYLRSHEQVQLKITGLNLGKVVKEFDGKDDALWPWALRVNVHLLSRETMAVTSGQAVLPVIPADNRLTAK